MQGKQPTISKDTERRFSGKSQRLEFGSKLRPNQRARLWRKIGANCRHELRIAPRWGRNSPPRRILDEIWRRDRKNEHRGAEKPILVALALYGVPASVDGVSSNRSGIYEFLRRHTEFIAQREYAVSPSSAAVDNGFSGVGGRPSRLTIQSVRMGPKFDDFPHLVCI